MSKLSIRDLPLNNHRVLMRVDFNVPLEDGRVIDDTRIRETLPTIEYALRHGARLVLDLSSRPAQGKTRISKMSLKPVAERLRMLLDKELARGRKRRFLPANASDPKRKRWRGKLEQGQTLLLENLRFHPEEEANDAQVCQATGRPGRLLRERRFWHRASRPCLYRWGSRDSYRKRPPVCSWKRSWNIWARFCDIPSGRLSRFSAAPKSATRSA